MAQYKNLQLIAYRVPTDLPLPAGNECDLVSLKLCKGLGTDLSPHLEELETQSEDALSRVTRMIAVIDRAMQSKKVSQDPATLKVFMAPEFYFRPKAGGAARSYTETTRHLVVAILRRVFAQKSLMGWIFVPGTIVWNLKGQTFLDDLKLDANSTKPLNNISKQDIVINTAMVGIGGHGMTSYDKLHYSEADNIDSKYRALLNKEKKTQKDGNATIFDLNVIEPQRPLFSEYFELMRKRNKDQCVLGVGDNRWFGIEVCLDHELRVLKSAYAEFTQTWPNNPPRLDFQLLTACGMRIQPHNVTVGEGHFILRNDGISCLPFDWKTPYDPSEIQRVTKVDNNGVLETTTAQNEATKEAWARINDIVDRIVLSGDLKLDATGVNATLCKPVYDKYGTSIESLDVTTKPLDPWFPQQLAVYRPLQLANF
ncbi:hypothetical protein ATI61_11733 [Archangium gephyra]|uniref:Uncharacterized protein n=1 Tax=Archangium gephyra TaxID=48 RepID=A0AAC8Q823_9BACT|nr:hypothetical protein [Archangium gephyra]AKJ02644.1 Hypothetical protein AA314_04270 [Archangium gephyra]REG23190.1 hypothetical protein ATI61_11733 [Archangium gephyra]